MKNLAYILLALSVSATSAFAAKPKAKAAAAKPEDFTQLRYDAEEALMLYDVDRADEIIETWQTKLSKQRKNGETPMELKNIQNRALTMRNMLERVEQIVIVDSLTVDATDFFKYYRLSADAGTIGGDAECTNFKPASGREEFYTEHNSGTNRLRIMYAGILDDGSREDATDTELSVGSGDVAYPFMLADGMTLYFASNADVEGSLGGYDIYMTRRNDEGGFYEPTNVGMPYNSPGNDYMMAIDETTGLGWWATDRNAEDGKLTIFVFIPNDTRQNYDPDRADITDRAFISSVAATQPEGFDAQAKLAVLDNLGNASATDADDVPFALSLGNGKVYHSLSDFRNSEARNMMSTYLSDLSAFNTKDERLRAMRRQYAEGNLTLADRIASAEKDLDTARNALLSRRNAIIKLELQR
jgi:hypothetical protein